MTETTNTPTEVGLIMDIYSSFRALPGWVQFWVMLLLMPINMASLLFLSEPKGMLVTFLANIGMMLNLPVMLKDRGFSKMMALPHLIPWTILVAILIFAPPAAVGNYAMYLQVLLVANIISLLFDFPDAIKWFGGDRTPAGR